LSGEAEEIAVPATPTRRSFKMTPPNPVAYQKPVV
jgi:hypothetical protein